MTDVIRQSEKKWLVFYTKSRQEKSVRDYLSKRGFEVFLPLQKVMRQWSDRKKRVEVPLFNSYIFVREREDMIPYLLEAPGMAWNIRHDNRPAIIHQSELDTIHRFLLSGLLIETGPIENFNVGDPVEVADGGLKGLRGTLIRTNGATVFVVELDGIGQSMRVSLPPEILKKV